MRYIQTLHPGHVKTAASRGGCGECQASCQSACKTSCTVANQACENESRLAEQAAWGASIKTRRTSANYSAKL